MAKTPRDSGSAPDKAAKPASDTMPHPDLYGRYDKLHAMRDRLRENLKD